MLGLVERVLLIDRTKGSSVMCRQGNPGDSLSMHSWWIQRMNRYQNERIVASGEDGGKKELELG